MTSDSDPEGPPSSPPPGWQASGGYAPPRPAPKPGLIPLRPLEAGSIIEGAVAFIRRQPKSTIGAALIAAFLAAFANLLTTALYQPDLEQSLSDLQSMTPGPGGTITDQQLQDIVIPLMTSAASMAAVTAGVSLLGYVIAESLLLQILGRDVVGQKTTIGEAWAKARKQVLPLLWQTILLVLLGTGIVAIAMAPALLLGAAGGLQAGIGMAVLASPVALAALLVVMPRFILAPPALVLEDISTMRSLRRSWRLVKGSYWRVLGLWVLGVVLSQVAASVISLPFALLSGAFATDSTSLVSMSTGSLFVSSMGTVVATALTAPALVAVSALIYLDVRMRRENLAPVLTEHARAIGTLPGN